MRKNIVPFISWMRRKGIYDKAEILPDGGFTSIRFIYQGTKWEVSYTEDPDTTTYIYARRNDGMIHSFPRAKMAYEYIEQFDVVSYNIKLSFNIISSKFPSEFNTMDLDEGFIQGKTWSLRIEPFETYWVGDATRGDGFKQWYWGCPGCMKVNNMIKAVTRYLKKVENNARQTP